MELQTSIREVVSVSLPILRPLVLNTKTERKFSRNLRSSVQVDTIAEEASTCPLSKSFGASIDHRLDWQPKVVVQDDFEDSVEGPVVHRSAMFHLSREARAEIENSICRFPDNHMSCQAVAGTNFD